MPSKTNLETSTLTPWREPILTMVKEKTKKFIQKIQPKQTKPILYDLM